MDAGLVSPTTEGTPQGGPFTPPTMRCPDTSPAANVMSRG